MTWFLQLFTWWHSQTWGTRLWVWRRGRLVGEDSQGNRYFTDRKDPARRYVIYNGLVEASRIPPEWHAWLHHTVDTLPAETGYRPRAWERPHLPNLTGSEYAYRPRGSLLRGGRRASTTGDYEAWKPE